MAVPAALGISAAPAALGVYGVARDTDETDETDEAGVAPRTWDSPLSPRRCRSSGRAAVLFVHVLLHSSEHPATCTSYPHLRP